MKNLIINTQFPNVTRTILVQFQLVERDSITYGSLALIIKYPNDSLSQELVFWLAMAQGCGLVDSWHYRAESRAPRTQEEYAELTRKIESMKA